jgi:Site-specific recombinases, DNA invertase Pin homologs
MTKKAIAYYRVSTELQKEEGTIEVQKMKVREFALKNEYLIVSEFSDDGFSGGLSDRPGLKELLDSLSTTEAEHIIIYKLDRLARDLYIQEGLIKEFNKNSKQLISTLEPDLDGSDPFRKAFRQMLGVFSEFEKAMIAIRLEGGRERKAKNGGWHGGKIYGYDNNEGSLIINKNEAETIQLIFKLRKSKKSFKFIANELTKNNTPTKRGKDKWSASTIKKMISNPIYKKGIISYKGERYLSSSEVIIR